MKDVKVGIVGIGGMGINYAKMIIKGEIPYADLISICDINPDRLKWARENLDRDIKTYTDLNEFLSSGIEAVIIATTHYHHPPIAIKAFEKGIHVLIEKPAGVYTKQVKEMNKIAQKSNRIFSIMYNQRTNPIYQKLKYMIENDELGKIKRITWIFTGWYRPQSYYDMNEWRGTWKGEGGGILLNQGIHQIDLIQWIFGMPKRIRAFLGFGKYHKIEVEDDAFLYMEYNDGKTVIFITSTGEAPTTNYLEVIGDKGKIVIEDEKIIFWKLKIPESEFRIKEKNPYSQPPYEKYEIHVTEENPKHKGILNNFISAIIYNTPLLVKGEEGINALEIVNASYLSSWMDSWIYLPIDDELYYEKLKEKVGDII